MIGLKRTAALGFLLSIWSVGLAMAQLQQGKIAVGAYHSVVLAEDGKVYTFGSPNTGVLGQGEDQRMDIFKAIDSPALAGKKIVDISVNDDDGQALILTDEGKVYGVGTSGNYEFGPTLQPNGRLTSPQLISEPALDTAKIVDVEMGVNFSVLVNEHGKVFVMGQNNGGNLGIGSTSNPITTPTLMNQTNLAGEKVIKISSSDGHTLMLTESNKVFAVGENLNGQLGDSTTVSKIIPVQIPQHYFEGKTIKDIVAGPSRSMVLTTDGTIYSFGNRHRLGHGLLTSDVLYPKAITHPSLESKSIIAMSSLKGVNGLSQSPFKSVLIATDGSVYVIGNNLDGQLGIGNFISNDTSWTKIPQINFENKSIIDASVSGYFTIFRANDGTLFGTGINAGTGYSNKSNSPLPVLSSGLDGNKIVHMDSHGNQTVVIDSTGSAYVMYSDNIPESIFSSKGRLRNINGIKDTPTLLTHSNLSGHEIVDVKAGGLNTYLLTKEGKVFSFGIGRFGTLGTGDSLDAYVPTLITHSNLDGKKIVDVAVAWNDDNVGSHVSHSLLLADDGALFSMGSNDSGQLGLGDVQPRFVPTPVTTNLAGKTIVKIAANARNSMAIASDGTVFLWGEGGNGEMGFGNTNDLNVPTLASHAQVGGKKVVDGAIGFSSRSTLNQPHFLIVLEDSTLYSFGEGSDGGLGQGNKTDNYTPSQVVSTLFEGEHIVGVKAGYRNTSMILTESGKIYSWGNVRSVGFNTPTFVDYSSPTLVVSDDLDNRKIVDIVTGTAHSLALVDDGTVLSFGHTQAGSDAYGAFGNGNEGDGSNSSDYPNQKLPTEIANFTTYKSPLPSGNLALHLDANRLGFITSNDSVSTWVNLAPNGKNGTQSNQTIRPILADSAINQLPALRFNGVNTFFTLPASDSLGIRNNDYELFLVAKTAAATNEIDFLLSGNSEQFELHTNGSAGARFIPSSGVYTDVGAVGDFSDGSAQLFNARASSTQSGLTINRSGVAQINANAWGNSANSIAMGVRQGGSFYFGGDIAEVIIYNSILNQNDRSTVERYLMKKYAIQNFGEVDQQLTGTEGWRFLSSPVADSTFSPLLNGIWTQGFTGASTSAGASNVYTWSTDNSGIDISNWQPLTDMSTSLQPGSGALVYVYSDDNGPDVAGDAGFPKTMNLEGIEPSGDRTLTSLLNTNVNGWALLGNPFKQDVDWDSFTKTNLSSSLYVWDNTSSDWKAWNGVLGDLTQGEIGAFNGFFVQTTGADPTLVVPQAAKTGNKTRFLGKQVQNQRAQTPWVSLALSNESLSNEMWVMFSEDAESGFDNLDALKLDPLSANYVLLGSVAADSLLLDINALPFAEEEIQIPLHFESTSTGEHVIELSGVDLPEGWEVVLYDTELDITTDLTEAYAFEIQSKEKKAPKVVSVLSTPQLKQADTNQEAGSRFILKITPSQSVSNGPISDLPTVLELQQNYPNPFNPVSVIEFGLPQNTEVTLEVFDVLGRKVASMINQQRMDAGFHSIRFDGANLASGMYIYRLVVGNEVLTKKMTLIK